MNIVFWGLVALIVVVATGADAQVPPIPLQAPPILVGKWSDARGDGQCTPMREAKGVTITADGRLIANNGSRTCRILQYEVLTRGSNLASMVPPISAPAKCVVRLFTFWHAARAHTVIP